MRFFSLAFGLLAITCSVSSKPIAVGSTKQTTRTAHVLAKNLMGYYNTADDGVVPAPYNWWQSGGLWSTMIPYWHLTGDTSYNSMVESAIIAQAGDSQDFMGTSTIGNDDQLWWAIACMTAAEYHFPHSGAGPSWLQIAENVFDEVKSRWDMSTYNGGLNWHISDAPGTGYKNIISNGLFFQLAARLGRMTGRAEYTSWANKIFDWAWNVNIINHDSYNVWDGIVDRCTAIQHDRWTYNIGVFLYGTAVMLDHTGDSSKWQPHLNGLIGQIQSRFTENGALQETRCEPNGACNTDQLQFKAFLSRWLAQTAALVPSTRGQISSILRASSRGAIASCKGGANGDTCGTKWPIEAYDGTQGLGQQQSALEIVQGLLAHRRRLPAKAS